MPEELLTDEQQGMLIEELVNAFLSINRLKNWLQLNLSRGLAILTDGNLKQELGNLFIWAKSEDGMHLLLQTLANQPPSEDEGITAIIYGITLGKIKKQRKNLYGVPSVPPQQNWFAADRPFVNRNPLRDHLAQLRDSPPGAKCIFVIDGDDRTGKSFSVSLATACSPPDSILPTIDIDNFARYSAMLDARELACLIAGNEEGCPSYDPTKESEAVPRLMYWLNKILKPKNLWIIIDHCNRKALTDGARSLLKELSERIRNGELPHIRLILVDFDRNELPQEWRDDVRYDRAILPDRDHVKEWCLRLATVTKRDHTDKELDKWASEVFDKLDEYDPEDGTWHKELERRLRHTFNQIIDFDEVGQ